MSTELSPYLIRPTTLTESMELARMISKSNFCPTQMRDKPGDVILALQMGSEVGLSPMQALQNIAVINGKPCLYGDGALAVAMSSGAYEYHKEWEEGSIAEGNLTAYCLVKRRGSDEYTKTFSMDDAKKASLWGKSGPWTQYPSRMLQMRARAFAIRDQFADALRGISIREEVEDFQSKSNSAKVMIKTIGVGENGDGSNRIETASVIEAIIIDPPVDEALLIECITKINQSPSLEELKTNYLDSMFQFKGDKKTQETLVWTKDTRKAELEALQPEPGSNG